VGPGPLTADRGPAAARVVKAARVATTATKAPAATAPDSEHKAERRVRVILDTRRAIIH